MKILGGTEHFPRQADRVRGVWAYRQALATRNAGAEICVLVLHRPSAARKPHRSSIRW
ncbi:MAG TPA: hypothetical protein VFP55_13840 [Solirubrobacteraceae bacterium]|nr:hypothetical protein [Solirubrobacteraceae bacterium]